MMWLSDGHGDDSKDDDSVWRNRSCKLKSTSPPLEGGESLCEFFIDNPLKKDGDNFLSNMPEVNNDFVAERLPKGFEEEGDLLNLGSKFAHRSLLSLLGPELLPADTFTKSFLQSILSSVDSDDPVVANAWMETLLDVIELLPKEIIKEEILTLAVSKSQISQPITSRLLCCRMLGKLCTKFESYIIKKEVLPVVLSLCQDVDYEVRGCMCRQLDVVAKGVGLEATKSAILPELVELCNDEGSCVRLAGIETVVQMLPLLDDESRVQAIIPLVQKFCENAINAEDSTLPIVTKVFGRLCHGLAVNLSIEQKKWFLKFFRASAKLGLSHHCKLHKSETNLYSPMPDLVPELDSKDRHRDCRHACAYNFPAMVIFAGSDWFESELRETFSELCLDPFQNVRRTMASGFHEIVKILKHRSSLLLPDLIYVLKDDNVEVLKGVIQNLPDTLKIICQQYVIIAEDTDTLCAELVKSLITCEETISLSSNWRLHAEYLSQMSSLPSCLPADIIYTTFVPLLFVKLHTARPLPCRVAAAYGVLVLLRNTSKLEQRNGIINELIRDLCNGRSCHKRMLFIKLCEIVMDLFSKAFFKRHFFRPVICLSKDRVPNIRLKLCTILPRLKSLMKLPKDSTLLQELESCVRDLMTGEKDNDVISAVNKAIEELDKIEVPTEPTSRRTSCIEVEADLEDLRKEEEERMLLELELRMQHRDNDDHNTNLNTGTRSLNRQGKIPVRKSGTLPKPSKPKEFKSSTLTKGSSISSPSKRLSKCYEKCASSPASPNLSNAKRNMSSSPIHKASSNINRRSISSIKCLSSNRPLPNQPSTLNIPRKPLDRCPSPMPPPRHSTDNRHLAQTTQKESRISTKVSEVKTLPKTPEKCDTKIPTCGKKCPDEKLPALVSPENCKSSMLLPSPEISRKAAAISNSRIPTPSSMLK